ncbi:MAG TPA: hypothetical protein VF705_04875, partial [Longimicrobium sp.]
MRDRLHRFALGITIMLVLSGCEYQNRGITMESPPKPLRLARAETTYKISIEDRARVVRGFDVDALERLLQMVIPEMR